MIIKQKQEDGTEIDIEVFSQEELDAKLSESQKDFEAKIAEKDTTLTTLAEEKAALEKQIGGVKEDHPNFKTLKDALKVKDEEVKKLQDDIASDKKTRQEEAMGAKIKSVSKGNEEVEKKIKLHLTNTLASMPETTEVERQTKFEAAVKLSSDHASGGPDILDGVMHNGGGAGGTFDDNGGPKVEFTAREKALGAKFGITAEDYKKYGPKLGKK